MSYWRYDTHTAVGAAWYTARPTCFALRLLNRGARNLVVHIVGLVPASEPEVSAFARQAGPSTERQAFSLYPATVPVSERLSGRC